MAKKRGFAAMSIYERARIASLGGKAAHHSGHHGHTFTAADRAKAHAAAKAAGHLHHFTAEDRAKGRATAKAHGSYLYHK